MSRENILKPLFDKDGFAIEENFIDGRDILNFVKEEVSALNISNDNHFEIKEIEEMKLKLNELGIKIFNLKEKQKILEFISFDEFISYLKYVNKNYVFVYEYYSDNFDDVEFFDYSLRKKLEEYDLLEDIENSIKEFLYNNDIKIRKIQILDNLKNGYLYSTKFGFMIELRERLNLCVEKLEEEIEFIEMTKLELALNETESLYDFLITDSNYLKCKNEKQRKLYKEAGNYLDQEQFENLKEVLMNKPTINSEKYIRCKPIFSAVENAFEKAREYVKVTK